MGFFNSLINFFNEYILRNTPDAQIERELNRLKKAVNKNTELIEHPSEFLTSEFAAEMFSIYKVIYPLAVKLKDDFVNKKGALFKIHLINSVNSDGQDQVLAELSEENLKKKIIELEQKAFYQWFEKKVREFFQMFNADALQKINNTYHIVAGFSIISKFDFFSFFREFDSGFKENPQSYNPIFKAKDGKYFIDDLLLIDKFLVSSDFSSGLSEALGEYFLFRGLTPADSDIKELFKKFASFKKTEIFTNLVKILQKNLDYTPQPQVSEGKIETDYLQQRVNEWNAIVEKIYKILSQKKLDSISEQLFSNSKVPPLHNYNNENNELFQRHNLTLYIFFRELYATKGFLIEKYDKYIKENINRCILGAKFNDANTQKNLSDNYYALNSMTQQILDFDNNLSDDMPKGKRIKTLMLSMSKDKNARKLIEEIIAEANAEAKGYIFNSIKNIKGILTFSQTIVENYKNHSKKLLQNIDSYDSGNTGANIKNFISAASDILLYLNIIKEYSRQG
ncbi:MAG: hypothetical protein A2096_04615 [Spirochaetes bacterium GWF1_41_5]|nr:MAG: hypothetical protein A2096_04615 [Spirochaetes bacterium GWF1_41_5]HBE01957.1 hypothetical protein [Spirochaetia bacterium]